MHCHYYAGKNYFIVLNLKKKDRDETKACPLQVKIGASTIKQEHSAKLLGITFNDKQFWSTQICGTDGVISGFNKRLFAIKRLKNHINTKTLVSEAALFPSQPNVHYYTPTHAHEGSSAGILFFLNPGPPVHLCGSFCSSKS